MNKIDKSGQKKILLDFYSFDRDNSVSEELFSEKKLLKLKKNSIKTVFILSSENVDLKHLSKISKFYQENEFIVKNIIIDRLDRNFIQGMKKAVSLIYKNYKEENCLILSYEKGFAGALIASLLIYMGNDLDEAIRRSVNIDENLDLSNAELSFVRNFYEFIKVIKDDDILEEETDSSESSVNNDDIVTEEHHIEKKIEDVPASNDKSLVEDENDNKAKEDKKIKKKSGKTKKHVDISAGSGTEKFYNSLRFKLISIISSIIIVSLSGMIFIATYYFKKDNKIRIQENNFQISQVISLKTRSDFFTLIDKSQLITRTMLRSSKGDVERLLEQDKDILFLGIAERSASGNGLKIIKKGYNNSLLGESQIRKEHVDNVIAASGKEYLQSFTGETGVFNMSHGFRFPVMGMSFPLGKGLSSSKRIVVCFIKLNRILKAFSKSDIVEVLMVNGKGDIIAHHDEKLILKGKNIIDIPIVKKMIKSDINNQQVGYTYNGVTYLGSYGKVGIGGCGVIAIVNEKEAMREVDNIQTRNIYLMIIVLTVVILIIFFYAKSLTMPIISLVAATNRIKEGDYNIDIEAVSKDEVGQLTSSFVEMGKGLEEREKMKDAFGKFVNKEIAEQAMKGEIQLGGERKEAAVFFSDIRSFTEISEQLEPEEVVEFLNQYMTRMVKCVEITKGVVDKYIGDAIMAIWGAPVSHGNDTENSVNAALLMREELIEFNKDRGGDRKPVIKIGCGINTGPVLAGQIGSDDRMEYTVIGDAVNLASRIEALNKPFGTDILISQDSYDIVKDIFTVEPMQKIKVKGKSDPQQIYAVLGKVGMDIYPKTIDALRELLNIDIKGKLEVSEEEEVKYEIIEE